MIVYINPISLFPELHSDKIYGAILATMNELYPFMMDEVLKKFRSYNPPFLISSAFPFINNGNRKIRFYPKVFINEEIEYDGNIDIIKKYDEIDYLQEEIFFDILNGKLSINELLNNYMHYFQVDNLLLVEDLNVENCFKKMFVPQNLINRLNNSNKFFNSEGIKYNDFCGVFFNITFFDNDYIEILESIFRLLQDRGFGSHISIGHGHFTYEIEEKDIYKEHNSKFTIDDNYFVILSRFVPKSTELTFIDENSYYELDFKRGKNKFDESRKQIIFFKEGSTFLGINSVYLGEVIDSSSKSVEIGFAFPLKIRK